jgi:hypothetical protein
VADSLREAGIKVVMGGPHVTECPDEALGRDGGLRHADAIALGEADETWGLIVEDAANGELKEIYQPDYMAAARSDGFELFAKAGITTLGLFLGLTAVVFLTRKDFSFLGPILMIGGFVALGFIASGIIFGFSLGNIFAFVMVAFAGAAILYDTSNVLHHYRPNQHVAASLTLFASVALLFWYILRIFMGSRD